VIPSPHFQRLHSTNCSIRRAPNLVLGKRLSPKEVSMPISVKPKRPGRGNCGKENTMP
jgi:hypothetical protein